MKNITTRRLCRAGIIAALYVALTYAFAPFAFGPFQIRPAEALCLLALIYPEAIPALWVGCMLSNITSPYAVYDVFLGALATLLAAFVTYMVGRFVKNTPLKIILGGIPVVLFNAAIIPLIIVFLCGEGLEAGAAGTAYLLSALSIAFTESVWVYALGVPLTLLIKKLRKSGLRTMLE